MSEALQEMEQTLNPTEVAETPETEPETRAADDTGEETATKEGEATEEGPKGYMIPKARLDQEIEKRRQLEQQLATVSGQVSVLVNQQQQTQEEAADDFDFTRPGEYTKEQATIAAQQVVKQSNVERGLLTYQGRDDWLEVSKAFDDECNRNHVLKAQFDKSLDPVTFGYEYGKKLLAQHKGETSEQMEKRLRAEIEATLKSKAAADGASKTPKTHADGRSIGKNAAASTRNMDPLSEMDDILGTGL